MLDSSCLYENAGVDGAEKDAEEAVASRNHRPKLMYHSGSLCRNDLADRIGNTEHAAYAG